MTAGGSTDFGSGRNAQCCLYSAPSFYPARQKRDFVVGEVQVRLARRHALVGVARRDAADQLAFVGLVRHDDSGLIDGDFAHVETQVCLARTFVRAVADEAAIGQDRADVEVVVELA